MLAVALKVDTPKELLDLEKTGGYWAQKNRTYERWGSWNRRQMMMLIIVMMNCLEEGRERVRQRNQGDE